MDSKINKNDFPSLDDLIDYYRTNEYINKHIQHADEVLSGTKKSYLHDEIICLLKEKGL